jgi:hypothetical protein
VFRQMRERRRSGIERGGNGFGHYCELIRVTDYTIG